MPEVRIENISKAYGPIIALNGVSLTVREGEYLSIVGPSGCGKTSLIKSVAGMVQLDKGEISMDGIRLTPLPMEDRGVGYVFQEIALFPQMTVQDNVSYGLMVKGVPQSKSRGEVRGMLDMIALSDRSSSYPSELSGGARQKVAVARALASGSSLLLLDEPLGALDLKVRTVLRYELRSIVKDLGLTAIHVTHDQEEALSISDRIAVMKAGSIVEVGAPMDLYMHPRRIFTAKFLGEANFMEGKVIDVSNGDYLVDLGGLVLRAKREANLDVERGDMVALAVRPEFVSLKPNGIASNRNKTRGVIKSEEFVGEAIRYEVDVENGLTVMAKRFRFQGKQEIREEDQVTIDIPKEHLLTYRYPEAGLEKELSLE